MKPILALAILALAVIATGCTHIPLRREFNRAWRMDGLCLDKATQYAINCWVANLEPRVVITHLRPWHEDFHAVVAFSGYPGYYFDPTLGKIWTDKTVGDIKLSMKYPFELGQSNEKATPDTYPKH